MSQEIGKGSNSLKSTILPNTQAGWRFHFQNATASLIFPPRPAGYFEWDRNAGGQLFTRQLKPSETASITPSQLKVKPFHWPFRYQKLYDPSRGSAEAMRKEVQYDLLATAIPAMSYAAAANPLDRFIVEEGGNGNFNMMGLKTDGRWPRQTGTNKNQWLHSDFRDVAFAYTWRMYERMIELGELDNEE